MWNALNERPANNGGPTAFEVQDLRYNKKGLELWRQYHGIQTFEEKYPDAVMGP